MTHEVRGRSAAAIYVAGVLVMLVATACEPPRDGRGYVKAPLARPGVLPRGEQRAAVRAHGEPNYTRAPLIEVPDVPAPPPEAPDPADVALPPGVNAELVAAGRALYEGQGNCFMCHGPAGSGSPIGPALNDAEWLHVDGSLESIARIVAAGVPTPVRYPAPMPAMGGAQLTDEQIQQVAAYVYTLVPR